jgi:uncharacterized membrane protein
MKPAGIYGLILIVIGIIVLGYGWLGSVKYTTTENVAKFGPLEVNKENEHRVPIAPIVGGVCIVGGILVMVGGARKAV